MDTDNDRGLEFIPRCVSSDPGHIPQALPLLQSNSQYAKTHLFRAKD